VAFSTGSFGPTENSEFVEALADRELEVCGSFDSDVANLLV